MIDDIKKKCTEHPRTLAWRQCAGVVQDFKLSHECYSVERRLQNRCDTMHWIGYVIPSFHICIFPDFLTRFCLMHSFVTWLVVMHSFVTCGGGGKSLPSPFSSPPLL